MHSDSTPTDSNENIETTRFDRRLDAVLASLPREQAGDGFTDAVMERLDHRRVVRRQWQTLAAAALVLLTVGLGTFQWHRYQEQMAAVERMAKLNAEYQVLQAEFEALEATRERARPVIYLGSTPLGSTNDDVDLVLDLWKLASASRAANSAGPAVNGVGIGTDDGAQPAIDPRPASRTVPKGFL
jgi:hypothetical protein